MFVNRLSSRCLGWLHTLFLPAAIFILARHAAGSTLPDVPVAEPEFILRNWDSEEGLPASNLAALARTPDGFLWLGTAGGLVRYDGSDFRTFSPANTPALPDAIVTALLTDHTGALWIGTDDGGLTRFLTNTFTPVTLQPAVPKASLCSLVEDPSGTIWGVVDRLGIFAWQAGKTTFYGTNSGLPSQVVWGLAVDATGRVWANCRGGLVGFENGQWHAATGLPHTLPHIYCICAARDGGLWLATVRRAGSTAGDRGIRVFKYIHQQTTEIAALPCNQDSRRSLPRLLLEDRQGRLWCMTHGAGIYLWDGQQWRLFSSTPSLFQVQTACAVEDADAVLWLGMDGSGLYQVRPRTVAALEPSPEVPSCCFWTVCASRDGAIWGGTDGNGIFRWQDGVATHFESDQGLTNEHVNAIIEDREFHIWAGTMGGLFRLAGGRFELVAGPAALHLPVFALKEDRTGRLWAGTRQGLVELDRAATNVFGPAEGIPHGAINAIEEDSHGRIWVSVPPSLDLRSLDPDGPYGLFVQSGADFTHVAPGQWAGASNIRSLFADATGNLWIGTIGTGFYRLRDGKFTEFSLADGLPHNRIQAIIADAGQNLWFCSEAGIFGCPMAQLENYVRGRNDRLSWWQIQHSDGLPSRLATGNGQPSVVRAADGRIWFADASAIAGFDPAALRKKARLRPPVIEDILVNGVLQPPVADHQLRITAASRRVEIVYASPNPTTLRLPAYWTRLQGFDPAWVQSGVTRVANYNLQPGDYEFSVAVTGPDGARLELASPLKITVVPQFWERTSVRALTGFLVVAGVALVVWRWERARSARRFRLLEIQRALDQVRQRIARDIHDDLGSGLTEITLLSDNLAAENGVTPSARPTVRRISERARALTHEMDELVWAINPQTDTLESLATYLNDFAQERLSLAGIRCRLDTAPDLPDQPLPADLRHSLYRAAREALNNAIKHSAAGEVLVTIESRDGSLCIRIEDNGRGFEPAHPGRRGNGLVNMHQRLAECGGHCHVTSRPGAGTAVCFTIPGAARRNQSRQLDPHPSPA